MPLQPAWFTYKYLSIFTFQLWVHMYFKDSSLDTFYLSSLHIGHMCPALPHALCWRAISTSCSSVLRNHLDYDGAFAVCSGHVQPYKAFCLIFFSYTHLKSTLSHFSLKCTALTIFHSGFLLSALVWWCPCYISATWCFTWWGSILPHALQIYFCNILGFLFFFFWPMVMAFPTSLRSKLCPTCHALFTKDEHINFFIAWGTPTSPGCNPRLERSAMPGSRGKTTSKIIGSFFVYKAQNSLGHPRGHSSQSRRSMLHLVQALRQLEKEIPILKFLEDLFPPSLFFPF